MSKDFFFFNLRQSPQAQNCGRGPQEAGTPQAHTLLRPLQEQGHICCSLQTDRQRLLPALAPGPLSFLYSTLESHKQFVRTGCIYHTAPPIRIGSLRLRLCPQCVEFVNVGFDCCFSTEKVLLC